MNADQFPHLKRPSCCSVKGCGGIPLPLVEPKVCALHLDDPDSWYSRYLAATDGILTDNPIRRYLIDVFGSRAYKAALARDSDFQLIFKDSQARVGQRILFPSDLGLASEHCWVIYALASGLRANTGFSSLWALLVRIAGRDSFLSSTTFRQVYSEFHYECLRRDRHQTPLGMSSCQPEVTMDIHTKYSLLIGEGRIRMSEHELRGMVWDNRG